MAMSEMGNKLPWGPNTCGCSHSTSYYTHSMFEYSNVLVFLGLSINSRDLIVFKILGCLIFCESDI